MKQIMHNESTGNIDNVATFEFNTQKLINNQYQLTIFNFNYGPLDKLQDMILKEYAGKKDILFKQLYEEHSVDTPYIEANYKEVFIKLLKEGSITAKNVKTGKLPRQNTFSADNLITFGGIQ
jgi:hypothetical protein